jgi:CheY-like chemotaxis protein
LTHSPIPVHYVIIHMVSIVVDNSPEIRNSLCYILLSFGIKGIPCADREEALTIIRKTPEEISCAVVDIDQKGTGGLELIEELKREVKTKKINIIVHTIQSDREAVVKMLELGVIGYLLKPYKESETPVKLHKILQRVEGQEKRQHIRITPDPQDLLRAHFHIPGYPHLVSGLIVNLSMGGLALELYSPVPESVLAENTHIASLRFILSGKELAPSGIIVVRNNKYLAVNFSAINQEDSLVLARYIFKRIEV